MLDGSQIPGPSLPPSVGVGYKPQHYRDILDAPGPVSWLEIHAENYMSDGGPQIAALRLLREDFPISCHGVGLSIGAEGGLDPAHLARLAKLVDWLEPAAFSEHLAWSTHETAFFNDLLPLPYTRGVLDRVVSHIDQVQDTLGRQMLLENPSSYMVFEASEMEETVFLSEIARRTGCGLLLDVNNVYVSATNQNFDAHAYLDALPLDAVGELHLGGHEEETDGATRLLIDSHSRPVVDPVWALYAHVIERAGPRPTLIEWDNDVPDWAILAGEAHRAAAFLEEARV